MIDLNSGISFFCYVETWALKLLLGSPVPGSPPRARDEQQSPRNRGTPRRYRTAYPASHGRYSVSNYSNKGGLCQVSVSAIVMTIADTDT